MLTPLVRCSKAVCPWRIGHFWQSFVDASQVLLQRICEPWKMWATPTKWARQTNWSRIRSGTVHHVRPQLRRGCFRDRLASAAVSRMMMAAEQVNLHKHTSWQGLPSPPLPYPCSFSMFRWVLFACLPRNISGCHGRRTQGNHVGPAWYFTELRGICTSRQDVIAAAANTSRPKAGCLADNQRHQ